MVLRADALSAYGDLGDEWQGKGGARGALNLWGSVDLVAAIYQGQLGVHIGPGTLGSAFYIPTVIVPPLLITHGLRFWLLLRQQR